MATAPHRAALSGDAKQAAALLKLRDVKVDAADKQRRTPLHGAVLAGHTQVAGLLLEALCNTDKADVKGMTPLVFAAGRGDAGLVRLLLKHGAAPRQSLQAAVTQGHTEAAELLLNAGAPVGATSERGASALHFAALKGTRRCSSCSCSEALRRARSTRRAAPRCTRWRSRDTR